MHVLPGYLLTAKDNFASISFLWFMNELVLSNYLSINYDNSGT